MAENSKPDISREALGLEKRAEKVTTGEVKIQKKSKAQKAAETFLGGDAKEVATYILKDVFLPSAKRMIVDMVSQGIERLMFGQTTSNGRSVVGSRVDYGRSYRYVGGGRSNISITSRERVMHDFNQCVFQTRTEAEDVLSKMYDLLAEYKVVRISDFYDLAGITSEFTDGNWGWYDLRGSSVLQVNGGYLVSLPPTTEVR